MEKKNVGEVEAECGNRCFRCFDELKSYWEKKRHDYKLEVFRNEMTFYGRIFIAERYFLDVFCREEDEEEEKNETNEPRERQSHRK